MEKKCITCNEIKTLDNFQLRKDTNKYRNQCKRCRQNKVNSYKRENMAYKQRYNEYRKKRRQTDIQYCMIDRLRARVRKMVNANNASKYYLTMDLLGCTMDYFKVHLTSKFYGDMIWEKKNFVLDHIIPCSWFNLSNPKHQKICFNYKNIQPLTDEDNSKKSDKVWVEYNLKNNPYI